MSLESNGTLDGAVVHQAGGLTISPNGSAAGTLITLGGITCRSDTAWSLQLGSSSDQVQTTNLTLGGDLTISAGSGFATGTYTIATYSGTLAGAFASLTMPANYSGSISTATAGQVRLVVGVPPAAPTLLTPVHCPDAGAAGPAGDDIATYGRTLNLRPRLICAVPSDADGSTLHFQVFVDGVAGSTLVANSTTSTTGFEWYDGAAWVAFPAGGATAGTGTVRYQPQADLTTNAASFWTMRASDGGSGGDGPSATVRRFVVASSAWTDPTLNAAVTRVRKVHMDELRAETNRLRALRGLTALSWTDATITADSTLIRLPHFTELRTGLAEVDAITGVGLTAWAEVLTIGLRIKVAHVNELRAAVEGL